MTEKELTNVNRIYEFVKNKFTYDQINTLSSLFYGLSKKIDEIHHIESLNREIETQNKKTAWTGKDPISYFEIPKL